ncbi:MAG: hypothetical protein MUF64_02875 [Polyangiaceae bacterium]|jgi:hypothetical protein|nr:hypothetical protein [Polyangiaceae bacterium]
MAELTAEERRRARAAATVKIIRPGEEAAAALEDARYWERIPLDKRAEFVWQLSVEVFSLATSRGLRVKGEPIFQANPARRP